MSQMESSQDHIPSQCCCAGFISGPGSRGGPCCVCMLPQGIMKGPLLSSVKSHPPSAKTALLDLFLQLRQQLQRHFPFARCAIFGKLLGSGTLSLWKWLWHLPCGLSVGFKKSLYHPSEQQHACAFPGVLVCQGWPNWSASSVLAPLGCS